MATSKIQRVFVESGIWKEVKDGDIRYFVKVFGWTPGKTTKKPSKSGYAPNLVQARILKKKLIVELDAKITAKPRPRLKEFFELTFRSEVEASYSLNGAHNIITAFTGKILPALGELYFDQLNANHISHFLNGRSKEVLRATLSNYRKWIAAFLKSARQHGLMTLDVMTDVKAVKGADSPEKRFLPPTKLPGFLRWVIENEHPWRYHYALAFLTGIRVNEQAGLLYKDIIWDRDLIYICRVFNRNEGFKDHTKNFEKRYVPLNPTLKKLLMERKVREDLSDEDFVLPQFRKWITGEHTDTFHTVLYLRGLPKMRYYDARATFTTALADNHVPINRVSEILGHSSIEETATYMRKLGIGLTGTADCIDVFGDLAEKAKNNDDNVAVPAEILEKLKKESLE